MTVKKVLISGASIAGPTAGLVLARKGINVTIVEKTTHLRGGGYPIDIRGPALEVVRRLGLLSGLQGKHADVRYFDFINEQGESVVRIKPNDLIGGDDAYDLEVGRGELSAAFYDATKDIVSYQFNNSIEAVEQKADCVAVRFANGESNEYDVVIGADGLHSKTRSLVFGPEQQFERYIGYCFTAFSVPEKLGRAHEGLIYNVPGKMVSIYPPGSGNLWTAMFTFRHSESPFRSMLSDEKMREITTSMFKGQGWKIPELIEIMRDSQDLYFDAVSQIRMPSWSSARVVLSGDSAHATSFLSGQGSSCALVSAYVLANEIALRERHEEAFAAYERIARDFIEANQALVGQGPSILIPDTYEAIEKRNEAIRAMAGASSPKELLGSNARRNTYNGISLPDYS